MEAVTYRLVKVIFILFLLKSYSYAGISMSIDGKKTKDGKGFELKTKITSFEIKQDMSITPKDDPETIILYEGDNTYLKNGSFFLEDGVYLIPGAYVSFEGLEPSVIINIGDQNFEAAELKNAKIKITTKKAEIVTKKGDGATRGVAPR
jgi:hypothetical protein